MLQILFFLFALSSVCLMAGCAFEEKQDSGTKEIPRRVLWAWERPEDLRWIKTSDEIGVAYLEQTIIIDKIAHRTIRRKQPLRITPGTYLIAVTRIETEVGALLDTVSIAEATRGIIQQISQTAKIEGVRAIQIDFDAKETERVFYRSLIESVRKKVVSDKPLSITALASWCSDDRWLNGLPVDEASPMLFDIGNEQELIVSRLDKDIDWKESLCRSSYGVAEYSDFTVKLKKNRRVYFFNKRPWTRESYEDLVTRLKL